MRHVFRAVVGSVVFSIMSGLAVSAQDVPAPYKDVLTLLGKQGDFKDNVLKVNIPRNDLSTVGRDDLKLTEMGAPINSRMGLNTWAAFVGTNDNAAIAGDVAMLATEVPPVLKALRTKGLDVVAIHHHMTATQPTIYFLHYWGTGPADKLAAGFRAALDQLGTSKATAAKH